MPPAPLRFFRPLDGGHFLASGFNPWHSDSTRGTLTLAIHNKSSKGAVSFR